MASTKLILYKSKILKNSEHPIMLRIIKDRKIKYISLGYSTKPELWNVNELMKGYPNYKSLNILLHKKKNQLDEVILDFEKENKDFSLEDIENKFLGSLVKITVFNYCEQLIDRLLKINKIGNANVYKDLLRTLKKFRKNKDLYFSDINYNFLIRFEENFLKNGLTENSISVYMRTLRALMNKAIKEGYCKYGNYPFKLYKISKFNTKTQKRAISKEEILKIIDYPAESGSSLWHSKNYFLFSFYNIGINFSDLAKLRWSSILNNRINYIRSKTGKIYDIKIHLRTQEILNLYLNNNENSDDYIFPILNNIIHKTPQSIKDRIKKVNKSVNKDLKKIASDVGIKATHSITHYVARHSWASIQKQNGTAISIISESMGHDSEKTTQIYLQSFINDVLDDANEKLI